MLSTSHEMTLPLLKTCLLVIDVQVGVTPEPRGKFTRATPNFEANIAALLSAFRKKQSPDWLVVHVRHHSLDPRGDLHKDSPGFANLPCAEPHPGETIVEKTTSSAFVRTELESVLREHGVQRLVVCGTSTAHCVSSTVRSAADLAVVEHRYGLSGVEPLEGRIIVANDATAVWWPGDAEVAQKISLDALDGEFCEVDTTASTLGRLGLT